MQAYLVKLHLSGVGESSSFGMKVSMKRVVKHCEKKHWPIVIG